MPTDVKFDAVSGDYYPIIYFNDYWNLQKDYYPINESLASLPLRVSFCPLSLWRWQLYAAQSTKSPWNFLGDELYEQSDEEQDSVKVSRDWGRGGLPALSQALGGEGGGRWQPGDILPRPPAQAPPPAAGPCWRGGSHLRGFCGLVTAFLSAWPGLLGLDLHSPAPPVCHSLCPLVPELQLRDFLLSCL